MSICHIFEEARCPHCEVGLIGKVVSYNLWNRENYLDGIVIITTYICLRCQITIYQEVSDFSFQESRKLVDQHNLRIAIIRLCFNSITQQGLNDIDQTMIWI